MDGHIPVLLEETIKFLAPQPGQVFVDATFGFGGHARALADRVGPTGTVVAIDYDPAAVERARSLASNIVALEGNFSDLASLVRHAVPTAPINGVLIDCGISSAQLSDPTLGLSFNHASALNMRLDRHQGMTAADIINSWPEVKLADLFYTYGEEPASRRIASAIVSERRQQPITETTQLADIIAQAVRRRGRIHPATRVFQALRIAVNDELGNLKNGIQEALSLLTVGGRLAVITFHSLEDRIAKQAFREASRTTPFFSLITKHAVPPSRQEILSNPRSRSAKLRVIERNTYVSS